MYTPSESDQAKLDNNFMFHTPKGDQAERHAFLRDKAKELAELMSHLCPPSRELSLAITNLEQAMFWANSSISRNENG